MILEFFRKFLNKSVIIVEQFSMLFQFPPFHIRASDRVTELPNVVLYFQIYHIQVLAFLTGIAFLILFHITFPSFFSAPR